MDYQLGKFLNQFHIRYFLVILLLFSPLWKINAQSETLVAEAEAENGVLTGVYKSSSVSGFSGTGYVTGFDNSGDQVKVTINIPEQGFYKLVIRYNGPSGDKYQDLIVNDSPASSVSFPATNTFADIEAGSFFLNQGENTFIIRKNWGWTNIDKFIIYASQKNIYNITPNLVDSQATDATKALYEFLRMQFGHRIISGQTNSYYNVLKNDAGKSPMIRAGDFQPFTEGYPYLWVDGQHVFGKSDNGSVQELINWYDSTGGKGIVLYQWHWHSPTGGSPGTNTFYTSLTSFDVTKAVTPGTQEYTDIIRDIDDIAAEIKKFQDAGIPILWRPLHEAGGGWFWWGAKGPEACKKLYDILYDRLVNYHQLHNLIWVWSTPEADWYPGNDKVDIIGYDSYPGSYNYGIQKTVFDQLFKLTNGQKLIAMSENGPIPDPSACLQYDAPWLYFMSWSNLVSEQNSADHMKEVFNNKDVISIESNNARTSYEWRSSLYPDNWKPGYKDAQGRFLHDFSYAGYHHGEKAIPHKTDRIFDVTLPPYNADNSGTNDVTAVIQQALDDVGASGGGVVYLPAGTYRIKTPNNADYGLRVWYDSTVLRGAGTDSTFIYNDTSFMRKKSIIEVYGDYAGWLHPFGTSSRITADLMEPSRILPVESVDGFNIGDSIIVTASPTDAFFSEHQMEGIWTKNAFGAVAFMRKIDSVDSKNKLLIIDAPTRYYLKTRDTARVYHAGRHIRECGIEDLSIGNKQNQKSGWNEDSWDTLGTGAYDVHFSHAIVFKNCVNSWVKNVSTYKPNSNTKDIHILSNMLLLDQCRFITIDSCFFQKPQYTGGGGNGYMYTLESNDCLIENSKANKGRHNYDFKYSFSNGNVILNCRAENSKYASDFHMYLSMANLFDHCTVDSDYLESAFRPYGGSAIHGYSSTQSVFYNTVGEAYHTDKDYIIDSRQFNQGYIIGTSGPAYDVNLFPVSGTINGYSFNTIPRDFSEGIGDGTNLRPVSLYLDQLDRRLNRSASVGRFHVNITVKDSTTGNVIPGCNVGIYNTEEISDSNGVAVFDSVYESFIFNADKKYYIPISNRQFVIDGDTSLVVYLRMQQYEATFRLKDEKNNGLLPGVSVKLGSLADTTDSLGKAVFFVTAGDYHYNFVLPDYRTEEGNLTIVSDTLMNFYLKREQATATFVVKNASLPVEGAVVRIGSDSLLTDVSGNAGFKGLQVDSNYLYTIGSTDYYPQEGSFYLIVDTTINISLEVLSDVVNENALYQGILLWPNPAEDYIYISAKGNISGNSCRILDLTGHKILEQKIKQIPFSLNIRTLTPGFYILQLTNNGIISSGYYFVKSK